MGRQKAQSLGEYTVTISIVILAIMAMTYFIQRGFTARINDGRRYMLTTLDADIRNVHELRGGTPYKNPIVEYEPYYLDKTANMSANPKTSVFINGPADTYTFTSESATGINSVSTELPAEDR